MGSGWDDTCVWASFSTTMESLFHYDGVAFPLRRSRFSTAMESLFHYDGVVFPTVYATRRGRGVKLCLCLHMHRRVNGSICFSVPPY
ncbi:hypothetical protein POVWA2_016340 [Plasmodium ovale wallikeri]|uniref:Uncharacterized protein n=1 Tax=Plasmodium ovale wallikeri TaxID=864142 RepID=A0A1A8YQ72_PLAOA|nr:hypothetical protein POVWA1_016620 [Plasmodium ovale wallikeri]SBT33759.1 hypothetical protein POVWA2_016340 [Plasmodium ovale wallikeri]